MLAACPFFFLYVQARSHALSRSVAHACETWVDERIEVRNWVPGIDRICIHYVLPWRKRTVFICCCMWTFGLTINNTAVVRSANFLWTKPTITLIRGLTALIVLRLLSTRRRLTMTEGPNALISQNDRKLPDDVCRFLCDVTGFAYPKREIVTVIIDSYWRVTCENK